MKADFEIVEEPLDKLAEYGEIPIRFEVRSTFEIEGDDPGSAVFMERAVEQPWVKDYDTIDGERPVSWPERWDISNWGLLVAYAAGRRAGGCAIAFNTGGVNMLEGRDDVAVLWDLRVHPHFRGEGIGHRLFAAAAEWARTKHCRELKAETQNINVPACRFYERQGCRLTTINRFAYEAFPEEIQLIWTLSL